MAKENLRIQKQIEEQIRTVPQVRNVLFESTYEGDVVMSDFRIGTFKVTKNPYENTLTISFKYIIAEPITFRIGS